MKSDIYGTLIIAVIILIPAIYVIYFHPDPQPEEPTHIWNEDLCAQQVLKNPGGLSFELAEVCYQPYVGWTESRTIGRLLPHEYDSLITPLFRQVRHSARAMGVYDEDHNLYMYRNLQARDRYVGRE